MLRITIDAYDVAGDSKTSRVVSEGMANDVGNAIVDKLGSSGTNSCLKTKCGCFSTINSFNDVLDHSQSL